MLLPGFACTLRAFSATFPAALSATLTLSKVGEAVQEVWSGCALLRALVPAMPVLQAPVAQVQVAIVGRAPVAPYQRCRTRTSLKPRAERMSRARGGVETIRVHIVLFIGDPASTGGRIASTAAADTANIWTLGPATGDGRRRAVSADVRGHSKCGVNTERRWSRCTSTNQRVAT